MAVVDRFDYADGTTTIPDTTVWNSGLFVVNDKKLGTSASVGNGRLIWTTAAEGRWSFDVVPTVGTDKNAGLIFRAIDQNNYWVFRISSDTNPIINIQRYTGGTATLKFNQTTSNNPQLLVKNLSAFAVGNVIKFYLNDELIYTTTDSTHNTGTLAGIRLDDMSYKADNFIYQAYTEPSKATRSIYTLAGTALTATKLGKMWDSFPSIVSAGGEEFWNYAIRTDDIPSWPTVKYPVILYSSTDHAGSGTDSGMFVRVYNSELGGIESPASWESWDDVSGRTEFDHITKKTNPIFRDSGQTETPTIKIVSGVVYMFYHLSVDGYGSSVQNTSLASGTNGIDFTVLQKPAVTYDPRIEQGDGHTGYFDIIDNPFAKYPYAYLGFTIHGGGGKPRAATTALWGSNNLTSWEKIVTSGWYRGEFSEFVTALSNKWMLRSIWVSTITPEGPYYRVVFSGINDIKDVFSPVDINTPILPVEVLIDDDFNVVSEPNLFVALGTGTAVDRYEISWGHKFNYGGFDYTFVKNVDQTNTGNTGLLRLGETAYDWEIFRSHKFRTVIQYHGIDDYSGLTESVNTTISDNGDTVNLTIPDTGADIYAHGSSIVLDDYDMVDIVLKRHGKVDDGDISGFVGLFDDIATPTEAVAVKWPSFLDNTQTLRSVIVNDGVLVDIESRKRVGVASIGSLATGYEESKAKQNYGIRIIPAERRAFVMDGNAPVNEFDLRAVDTSVAMYPAIIMRANDSTDRDTEFESFEVVTYSNGEISPVISITESIESINFESKNPSIALESKITIIESISNIDVFIFNPAITLTPESSAISITEKLVSIMLLSLKPTIKVGTKVYTSAFYGAVRKSEFYGIIKKSTFSGVLK